MERTTMDLWVGVLVLLGLASFFGLAMKVGNLTSSNLGPTYSLTAAYENVGGLKPRAPVKSAGVVVGRIADIRFDPATFEAIVHLDIDKRYSFPKDTFANIYTAGLLGEQYIGLEAGGDEEQLAEGDRIRQTQDAVVLEKMISRFLFSKASEETPAGKFSDAASTKSQDDALVASPLDNLDTNSAKATE